MTRLRTRILLCFVLGLLAAVGAYTFWVRDTLKTGYRKTVEEMMVDMSQLLASVVETQTGTSPRPVVEPLARTMRSFEGRRFEAVIHDLRKRDAALDVYVTDERGVVLYSSESEADVGKDFSRWNDVRLTLDGRYGARRTRRFEGQETSVFYVGAPIREGGRDGGRIIGSLSLVKDRDLVGAIVSDTLSRMAWLGLLVFVAATLVQAALFAWVTRPLQALRAYALDVAAGRRAPLPRLSGREVVELGRSFEEMRVALEGKKTIERFTHSLTHEMKSPLSAIRGAAELSLEPMDEARRARFLRNIIQESSRAQEILELLLEVAALESKTGLDRVESVDLARACDAAREALVGISEPRRVRVERAGGDGARVQGDPFLLQQAVRNVLQNAIEFSPEGGVVRLTIEEGAAATELAVRDEGPGIPEFARPRLFEKFFSLERPATGRKGTGLGLSFTREVMTLHGGTIELPAGVSPGTRVVLRFPRGKP